MTVGERIKERRKELGLSQSELAKRMGYSDKTAVSKAEIKGDNIQTTKVMRYAEALGCSFNYLMGWEDATPEDKAGAAAEIITNPKLMYYMKKLLALDEDARNQIYSLIDLLSK